MVTTSGEAPVGLSAGMHVVDGETFETRYVDPADAAIWAGTRDCALSPEDIPPAAYSYLD